MFHFKYLERYSSAGDGFYKILLLMTEIIDYNLNITRVKLTDFSSFLLEI